MRIIANLLLLLTLTTTALIGQQPAYYAVQIGAFLEARHDDFAGLRQKAFIYSAPTTDNTVVVFAGDFADQAAAEKLANELRQMGYGNAYTVPRELEEGETASVIQLATRSLKKPVDWERYLKVGDVFAIINGNTLKVVTGLYGNIDLAKKALPNIRKQGFKDAFVKNVNTVFLHPISEFESGVKEDLIPIAFDNSANRPTFEPSPAPAPTRPGTTPRSGVPAQYDTPVSYDIPQTTAPNPDRPAATLVKGEGTPVPNIRGKVKRTSVLDLQKILKSEKVYDSGLDGYYGPGTTKGFNTFWESDRETQQARRLAAAERANGIGPVGKPLQKAINELYDDPQAPAVLQQSLDPVARAYEAYLLYQSLGPNQDVNNLMNEAIQKAFANSGYQGGFDYRSTYAYQDLNQLIQHLLYIHGAPNNEYVAPCWLFDYHQAETTRAYATFAGAAGSGLKLRACDQLMEWEELATLQTLAAGLNPRSSIDQERIAKEAGRRAKLYLAPRPLNKEEATAMENWNTRLWKGLDAKAAKDALYGRKIKSLKVLYLQNLVRLEDYYMNKGFKAKEARGLALAALHTMVNYHLEGYAA